MGYENRSKVAFVRYDEIQAKIRAKELDAYDIVYTKDTHENLLITPELTPIPIQYRVYRFTDARTAEEFLNDTTDTYEGQLVSIQFEGRYSAYMVNRNSDGFYVTPLNQYSGEIDYDILRNRPIVSLTGSLDSPVVVSQLNDGIYTVKGQYLISPDSETTYLSSHNNLFLVSHGTQGCCIRKITAEDITNYTVSPLDGIVSVSFVPTTDYLNEQGYSTTEYVDQKVAAMNFLTKAEVDTYVANLVAETIDDLLDQQIEMKIDEKFSPADSNLIAGLFN